MEKINVAVFFGGHSSEYGISLKSAEAVLRNLNPEKYRPIPVGISREGKWYLYTGEIGRIGMDRWLNEGDCIPAALSPSRGERSLLLLRDDGVERVPIDAAFPVMHGRYGEDGTIQGLIELAGVPLVGCGVLASALCMDKDRAHRLAQLAGVEIPRSCVIRAGDDIGAAMQFIREVGCPVFVKPVRAGSSYGISKVLTPESLQSAVDHAFEHDGEVIVEEAIDGFEVGCAVMGRETLVVGEVDEIELADGFFDFVEKYTLKTSAIHVPARISSERSDAVKAAARKLYRALGCSGFARIDLFMTPQGRIVFNEVNTIPGFTEHSRFPGMMKAAGISFTEILDSVIGQAVSE